MGEVYRAHDPRLGRDVAIKVIPASFVTDPDRLRRFEQEARAAAALSHPNILAVHDVGTHESSPYIVSELLAGVTLRDRMSGGPLPVRKAVDIAVQVANGLAAAHAKSIVHRDLKPENLFVTDDGRVKILDFGLAKLTEVTPVTGDQPTKQADTTPGAVMGTAGYMSPEQLRGLPVDHRSDIFAFGAVLYELLAGARAFRGETSMDIATAILKEDPPDLPVAERHIPPALSRIVDRCLEKSASARFQSAGDLAFALESLSTQSGTTTAMPAITGAPRRRMAWLAPGAIGLALGLVVTYGVMRLLRPAAAPNQATAFELLLPSGLELVSALGSVSPGALAVSPDGRQIALLAAPAGGARSIWIRSLESVVLRQIPGTENALSPFWSPDSRHLAFFADRKLKRVALAGGPPTDVCDLGAAPVGGSWSSEGVIVFGVNQQGLGIQRVAESGGEATSVTAVEAGDGLHTRPWFLPDGRHFLFRVIVGGAARGWLFVGSIDGTPRTPLLETESSNNTYSAGHVLFLLGTTLMARPFDADRLQLTGEAFPITQSIQTVATVPTGLFSTSANGVLVYRTGDPVGGSDLVWLDRKGSRLGTVTERGIMNDVRLFRDGTRVAVSRRQDIGVNTTSDIWIIDTAAGSQRRFTFEAGNEFSSAWSPDGSRIAFNSSRRGPLDLFVKPADGSGIETELLADDRDKSPADWSPDGKHLLIVVSPGGRGGRRAAPQGPVPAAAPQTAQGPTGLTLWILPLEGDRKMYPLGGSNQQPGGFYPADGRWLVYGESSSGQSEVYVVPFPATGVKYQVSKNGGSAPRWSADGTEIFFLAPGPGSTQFMAARVDGKGSAFRVLEITKLFDVRPTGARGVFGATPDGKKFLFNLPARADQATAPSSPVAVLNWPALRGK